MLKTVNTRENFRNVYCFATNQMWHETAKDNRQTAALISHDLTRDNKLGFSSNFFNFPGFKYWNFSFSTSALVSPKNKYELNLIKKKMSQSQTMFLSVCFTYSSKGHASWLWLVIRIFCGRVTFTHDANLYRCIVHFHVNSVVWFLNWQNQVTGVAVKNSFFREIHRNNWRFLVEERASSLLCIKSWLIPAHLASNWSRSNEHSRHFL